MARYISGHDCGYINGNKNDCRKDNLSTLRGFKNGGKTILNGYVSIYFPEHHRAFDNGCVYEHILVAEEKLGRKLRDEEVVHHINKIKTDNRKENLMVFKTNSDHIGFHNNGEAILEGDVYVCKKLDTSILCPICHKNLMYYRSKMCFDCSKVAKRQIKERPSKEVLENLIYTCSFVGIGKMFGVTDNAIRKWCKEYGLPSRKKDLK